MMHIVRASLALILAAAPVQALAWGNMGHRIVGVTAMEALPPELPAFLLTPQAAADVGELSREPDRSKDAGRIHDHNRNAAHFVDVMDDGTVMGGPKLSNLPATRADYEKALQAAGADSWKAGYLPYAIVDEWQQLAKDLAYWRVLTAGERLAASDERRAWFARDRERREALVLHTLGRLSHYVADGAQPLHATIHYNGWGDFPNPKGYTRARIHGVVEGDFVVANAPRAAVVEALGPPRPLQGGIEPRVAAYLERSWKQVEPLYALEKAGGFKDRDARGAAFVIERLADGAGELRDLIVAAWAHSGRGQVGWKPVKVEEVEAGRADPFPAMYGAD